MKAPAAGRVSVSNLANLEWEAIWNSSQTVVTGFTAKDVDTDEVADPIRRSNWVNDFTISPNDHGSNLSFTAHRNTSSPFFKELQQKICHKLGIKTPQLQA